METFYFILGAGTALLGALAGALVTLYVIQIRAEWKEKQDLK